MYATYGLSAHIDTTLPSTFIVVKEKPPKYPKVHKDKDFANEWEPVVREEVDGLINGGKLKSLTWNDFDKHGFRLIPHCFPLRVKRSGKKKGRLAICGNFENPSLFPPGSCFSPTLGEDCIKLIIAFAFFHRMILTNSNQTQAFCISEWSKSACPRKIAILLDSFASGTGKEELMEVTSVQYGFRDANHAWSETQDEGYKNGGYIETPECRKCYTKRKGTHGLIIFGITTDDNLIAHTNNVDGQFLYKEFRSHTESLWKSTFDSPCAEYIGLSLSYNSDSSVTLTQPSQVRAIQEHFLKSGPVSSTFLPLPIDWSPILSKDSPRCNLKQYQRNLGTVAFMRLTMGESNTISLLSTQSKNPSDIDLLAVRHFAAFIITRCDVGVTYHPSPIHTDINECTPIHIYSDFFTW